MKSQLIEYLLRAISFLPIPAQRRLGNWLGSRLYKKQSRDYRNTKINLTACFPEKTPEQIDQLAQQSLKETATWAVETAAVWFRSRSWLEKAILSIENRELFERSIASDRGVILLTPHFGNWELAGMWACVFAPTTAIYRTPRMQALDGMLQRVRGKESATMVPATSRGVMGVVKALSRGEMTIVLPDQEPTMEGGIFSQTFGVPALTMTLINRLILKTNPIVLVTYARRVESGHIVGFCEPDAEIYSEDQQTSVDAMNRSIEQLVLTAPAQYQWEYKRFKTRPEGFAPLYQN